MTGVTDAFDRYLNALRATPIDEKTEHTDQAALESLLNALREAHAPNASVQHEPKRAGDKGSPDFRLSRNGMVVGYVEVKTIGENLDRTLRSDQITKYVTLSPNIVLTDYLHFIWVREGKVVAREQIAHESDVMPGARGGPLPDRAAAVEALLRGFVSSAPEGIGRAEDLALALATRCRLLRDGLASELMRQTRAKPGRLYGLYDIFRTRVFAKLETEEFADAFAQMLGYGLFLSKYNAGAATVTLHNVEQFVPRTFELIRELVDFLDVLDDAYADVRWVVEEIVSLVNAIDLAALSDDLSFDHRRGRRGYRAKSEEEARLFERDPYVYFYETFLARYDAATRESRGVYYTPPPVVNFIVRAVDEVLERSFGIRDGLADRSRVTVLDFATGTGTFMLEVFQRVLERVGASKAGSYVGEHLAKNVYGFEYLIAPYTIAHLKLSQFLAERARPLAEGERLQVYLTNTLEPIDPQYDAMLPKLSDEVEAVKDRPILAIVGNPPYSGVSRNMGAAAKALIERYKHVDGKPFGERKHWLHDDYVKFIAFAQKKMDEVEEGVVGIITNHSFIDNPTFRGMRQSLMSTFDQIYILDLHGNANKREVSPDGSVDQNVFDIRQGVAISLFVKGKELERGVWHADMWGDRLGKYEALSTAKHSTVDWELLTPQSPYYFFIPRNTVGRKDYLSFSSIKEIMHTGVAGIITARDKFVVSTEPETLRLHIADFADINLSDEAVRSKYGLRDTRGWKMAKVRQQITEAELVDSIRPISYRPFDDRYILYNAEMVDWGREDSISATNRSNVSLATVRQVEPVMSGFTASLRRK